MAVSAHHALPWQPISTQNMSGRQPASGSGSNHGQGQGRGQGTEFRVLADLWWSDRKMGEQRSTISSSASQLSQMGSHRDALLFRKPAHMRSASCSACTRPRRTVDEHQVTTQIGVDRFLEYGNRAFFPALLQQFLVQSLWVALAVQLPICCSASAAVV